jgi:hypothetical protein
MRNQADSTLGVRSKPRIFKLLLSFEKSGAAGKHCLILAISTAKSIFVEKNKDSQVQSIHAF